MNKKFLIGIAALLVATNANAGLFGSILGKKSEPATLEEACDTNEITSICSDMILGDMTMTECLMQNINRLSDKCATYVKKSAGDKVNAAKNTIADKKAEMAADKEARADQREAKKAEINKKIADSKEAAKAKIEAKKAEIAADKAAREEERAAKKAAAQETAQAAKDAANKTAESAKETGKGIIGLFK